MATDLSTGPACPVAASSDDRILLAHGGGGRLTNRLIETLFAPTFANAALDARHDGACVDLGGVRVAFSTDSYVVRPLFFPGGDIGTLAVNGTVNDLAMCGARPVYLSAGFVIEEGLPVETLARVAASMQVAALAAGVTVVTGDTKVVDRGKGDGLYLNTAGIGLVQTRTAIAPSSVRPGDVVILSGDVGRHGMAVMAARESLQFESSIESDCAPLAAPVIALLDAGIEVHCLRDLTRGGLATAIVEIAQAAGVYVRLDEKSILLREDVRGACEILGFDPLYVANEGRFIVLVPPEDADRALAIMRACDVCRESAAIGRVFDAPRGVAGLTSRIGATRVIDMLSGEQLPRIC